MLLSKHLKVLTSNNQIYDDVLRRLRRKVKMPDIVVLTKDNFEMAKGRLAMKPFFSTHYYVEIHMRGLDKGAWKDIYKIMDSGYAVVVFICSSVEEYERINADNKREVLGFNGYNPPDAIFANYIRGRYKYELTDRMAIEVKRRLRGNYHLLDSFITKMNETPPKNLTELRKIIPKLSRIGMWRAFLAMVLRNEKDKKRTFELLADYKNGGKFLIGKFSDYLDVVLKYYGDFYDGKLNSMVIQEFIIANKERLKEDGVRDNQVEDLVAIYNEVSYEYLLLVKKVIHNAKGSTDKNMSVVAMAHHLFNLDKVSLTESR